MKTYIFKTFLMITTIGFMFYSCNNDDDAPSAIDPITTTVSLTSSTIPNTILESDGEVDFFVTLGSAIPFDVVATISAISTDGSIESNPGMPELTYNSELIIPAGTIQAMTTVIFNDDGISDGAETYTFTLSNVRPVNGDFPDASFITPETPLNYEVMVEDPPVMVTTIVGDADIELTWVSGDDMDLRLYAGNQDTTIQIDGSFSVSSSETVTLPGGSADGFYSLWVEQWPSFSGSEDVTVTLTFPSGSPVVFMGTITSDGFFLLIEKTTNGSDVTYVLSQL